MYGYQSTHHLAEARQQYTDERHERQLLNSQRAAIICERCEITVRAGSGHLPVVLGICETCYEAEIEQEKR